MRHRPALVLVALATAIVTAPPSLAGSSRHAAHTKKQAEVNVLRVVERHWKTWRRTGLVDARTHLLADNTEAVCRGRGERRAGSRYSLFVCVVRPHSHRRREGLWLSYRALAHGRFRIRVLAYRRR
jgi:hypothetical protein